MVITLQVGHEVLGFVDQFVFRFELDRIDIVGRRNLIDTGATEPFSLENSKLLPRLMNQFRISLSEVKLTKYGSDF